MKVAHRLARLELAFALALEKWAQRRAAGALTRVAEPRGDTSESSASAPSAPSPQTGSGRERAASIGTQLTELPFEAGPPEHWLELLRRGAAGPFFGTSPVGAPRARPANDAPHTINPEQQQHHRTAEPSADSTERVRARQLPHNSTRQEADAVRGSAPQSASELRASDEQSGAAASHVDRPRPQASKAWPLRDDGRNKARRARATGAEERSPSELATPMAATALLLHAPAPSLGVSTPTSRQMTSKLDTPSVAHESSRHSVPRLNTPEARPRTSEQGAGQPRPPQPDQLQQPDRSSSAAATIQQVFASGGSSARTPSVPPGTFTRDTQLNPPLPSDVRASNSAGLVLPANGAPRTPTYPWQESPNTQMLGHAASTRQTEDDARARVGRRFAPLPETPAFDALSYFAGESRRDRLEREQRGE